MIKFKRGYNKKIGDFLSQFIPRSKGKALDVGCGEGYNSIILKKKGYYVIGIDIDERMLELSKNRCDKIKKVDVRKGLPFKDESFDFILACDVLEHIHNPKFLLKEIYRILKKDKKAIIRMPNGPLDIFGKGWNHVHYLSAKEWDKMIEDSGFQIIQKTHYFIIPVIRILLKSIPNELLRVVRK